MSEYEIDLEGQEPTASEGTPPSLPFDVITLLLGIWRRKIILIAFAFASLLIGYAASALLSTREYEAKAVLLYDPPALEDEDDAAAQLSLNTLVDLFKTRDNLEAVRNKLKMEAKLKVIGAATSIELRRKTTLLELRTRWDDPQVAADLANAVYQCFFEHLTTLQGNKRGQALDDLKQRLNEVKDELTRRDQELKQFTMENRIVDLDKEAQWYLQQLVTLNTEYDRTVSRLESARKQRTEIDTILKELKASAREESSAMAAQMSSVTENNIRIQRLRELIQDAQETKARAADLTVEEEDLKRAKKLRELDAISQSEFDKITAEYERAKALAFDSDEIKQWKEEIKKLDQTVVPQPGAGATLSGDVMRSVMIKAIELQLEETAYQEQVKSLEGARKRTQERLSAIPQVKQAYAERERRVEALVSERKTLQNMIATTTRRLQSSQVPFRVVSQAEPMFYPRKSNRKLIFVGIVFVGIAAGGLLVLLLELIDFTIKSEGSLRAALQAPALGVMPRAANDDQLLPGPRQSSDQAEAYRRLALAIRRRMRDASTCVVVTGGSPGAGVSTVTLNLAVMLQRRGERVLIVDGHTQPDSEAMQAVSVADYIEAEPASLRGLGDHLSEKGQDTKPYSLQGLGVDGIPRVRTAIEPEALSSARMAALIARARDRYTFILIDAPPLATSIDAEYLAERADAILYVVRGGKTNILEAKRSFKQLQKTGVPIAGAVLTDVHELYLRT